MLQSISKKVMERFSSTACRHGMEGGAPATAAVATERKGLYLQLESEVGCQDDQDCGAMW
jgi:hypothetical protein